MGIKNWVVILALSAFIAIALNQSADAASMYRRTVSLLDLRIAMNQDEEILNIPDPKEYRDNYKGPREPNIPKVEFEAFDPPMHLQGQVDSLIHGIKISLPAEYDHYGYELRRYMKSLGRFDIYSSREAMEKELNNIKKARIIFKYWRDLLSQRTEEIKLAIEQENASSKVRTTFKVNSGIIRVFIIETQAWLNANEALLEFLKDRQRYYVLNGSELGFLYDKDKEKFVKLYSDREKRRQQMYKYDPFRLMVY